MNTTRSARRRSSDAASIPLVLLTGHRKSGTTLFHSLFDGHPDLCSYPIDLGVLYAYFPHFISYHEEEQELRARLDATVCAPLERTMRANGLEQLDMTAFREELHRRLEVKSLRDTRAVISGIVSVWSDLVGQTDRQWTVVKETSADIYASEIYQWFPRMRMIQLVRDPRDNFAALKAGVASYYSRFGEGANETLASMLHRGRLDMRMALLNRERFGADRYAILRFEDLVRSTDGSMRTMAAFLDIEFAKCMVVPTIFGQPARANTFEEGPIYAVSGRNIGRWRERITPSEAKVIEFHFRGIMEEFGYEPEYTASEQADAYTEFYKWLNYRYYYSDVFSTSETEQP